jgi:DNA-binding response OmpR family regulator
MVSGFADERHKNLVDKKLHENMLYKPYNSDKLLLRARILLDENGLRNKIKPDSRNLKSESFPKRKILILDDDEDVLDLSAINLKKLGYLVITVSNSEEAIKQFSLSYKTESPIDVVIVDLSIPGNIGGVEVAKRIIEINSKARIIVASGNTEGPEMKTPEQFGFIGALEKNFDISNIKSVLEKALEN